MKHDLKIPFAGCEVGAELRMTEHPAGIVVLVHGSGTTRQDPVNRFVAARLVEAGFAALLVDLLEECETRERHHVFDLETQVDRLLAVRDWLRAQAATRALPIGYYGGGIGAGVALMAAARAPEAVRAIVVRGGRPDAALYALPKIMAPTLFIAAGQGADAQWVRAAYGATPAPKELVNVRGAGDAFGEPGAQEAVAEHACRWFRDYLTGALDPRIRALESELKQRHPGCDCRVTVEEREPHAYERRRFNVRLDVACGERAFVVNREHEADPALALTDAFRAANHQLSTLQAARQ